jgi:hypothetical protein
MWTAKLLIQMARVTRLELAASAVTGASTLGKYAQILHFTLNELLKSQEQSKNIKLFEFNCTQESRLFPNHTLYKGD